jgi:hypothetical protein
VCLSNGSLPLRLRRDEFGWELEVYRLARVDRGVYRPEHTRIRGEHAIVEYQRKHDPSGVLAHTTACLMRTFPNLRGQFSACNGDWQLDASIPRPLRLVAANATLDGSEPERKSALER